jgi:hypothetical protein
MSDLHSLSGFIKLGMLRTQWLYYIKEIKGWAFTALPERAKWGKV